MVSTLSAACPIHSPVKQQLLFSLVLDMRESNPSAELTELCQRDSVRSVLSCCATGFTSVFCVGFWSTFGDPLGCPTCRCADVASVHLQCFL